MDKTPPDQRKAPGQEAQVAPRPRGLLRFSAARLLIALVLLVAASPFFEFIDQGGLIESILWTVVMVSAAMFVGVSRRLLLVAMLLAAPAVIGRWIHHLRPDLFTGEAAMVAGLLFTGFVVVQMLRFILRVPTVNSETLCAAVATLLLLPRWSRIPLSSPRVGLHVNLPPASIFSTSATPLSRPWATATSCRCHRSRECLRSSKR